MPHNPSHLNFLRKCICCWALLTDCRRVFIESQLTITEGTQTSLMLDLFNELSLNDSVIKSILFSSKNQYVFVTFILNTKTLSHRLVQEHDQNHSTVTGSQRQFVCWNWSICNYTGCITEVRGHSSELTQCGNAANPTRCDWPRHTAIYYAKKSTSIQQWPYLYRKKTFQLKCKAELCEKKKKLCCVKAGPHMRSDIGTKPSTTLIDVLGKVVTHTQALRAWFMAIF